MLLDPRVRNLGLLGGRGRGAPRPMQEAGGEEPVERLPHLELPEPRVLDQPMDVPLAVDQREESLLGHGERHFADGQVIAIDDEDHVERRNLLLDQAPLVHPTRALEQQRLGIDRTRKSCRSGWTSVSKLNVPWVQVNR